MVPMRTPRRQKQKRREIGTWIFQRKTASAVLLSYAIDFSLVFSAWFNLAARRVTLFHWRAGSVSDRRTIPVKYLLTPVAYAPGSPVVTRPWFLGELTRFGVCGCFQTQGIFETWRVALCWPD